MNGVRRIVILRSRSDGSVRLAMTPGTVQPKPISIGTILLPERPILRRSLSMTKATLAIYPLSSRIDRKKNSVTIIGRKASTLPTPLKIPSITSECTTGLIPYAVSAISVISVKAPMPMSRSFESHEPITPNVSQNTSPIIPTKAGIAVYFPVKTLSIFTLRACSLLSLGFTTVSSQIC